MDSERRYVTVVYADISGFTAISEQLDPEEVTDVMNRCFESLEAVVLAHGGLVNKYLGDCVLALFGITEAPEVAARKAVEAAAEIRATIYRFNKENDLPANLDVHVGVNGGPVIAGMIGGDVRREYAVTGDAATFAARLEDASERGQIFVGPDTYRDTQAFFEYRPVEPIALRENEPPLPVYEFLGPKDTRKRVKRQSERRRATVLFADVFGFKALAERLPPEEVTQVLNRCLTMLAGVVASYGGVVDKYIGECVMALFGVPNAIENAPQQAVNAAIEMRNRLHAFNEREKLPVELHIHIGVNTGLVIAGDIGGKVKRDFTVMGDTVNLASRLKDAAAMGSIYVGPETYRSTQDIFQYRPLEPLRLKGKAQPVPTYEVLSIQEQVHRTKVTASGRMVFSDLVGRENELKQLIDAMAGAVDGRGGIVSLIGEAGLGKSRLLAEAVTYPELGRATVLQGRCTSIGQNLSFHPFIDLLRQWAGITDEDVEATSLHKLETSITRLLGAAAAAECFPFVATLMGLRLSGAHAERVRGIDADAMERLMVKSTRDLLNALGAHRPLILIFEDLHWADQSSVKLLEQLLRLAADRAVLFVNVFRPDYQETAERIMQSALENFADRHVEIRIEPLDAQQSAQLVQNLLKIDNLPPATRKLITERAEGNPFYLEEVVRGLIDTGAVEFADGRFRVTEKIESVVIPGTVQEVIMSRVDRLDESTRHLLQVASVIGRNFYHRIIAEILRRQGQLDDELDEELATLKEKQLLLERKARWTVAVGELTVVEELEYIFKHALAQQTVYESLLNKTRKEFHLTVAESIESLFADRISDFYGMLAHHYNQAEHLEKAEDYLFKAGEEAARAAASAEALNFFREARRVYLLLHPDGGDPHRRMLLEKNIGMALWNKGSLTESIEHFTRALEYLGERTTRNPLVVYLGFARDMTSVLLRLFVQPNRRPQPRDIERDRHVISLIYARGRAMITGDPQTLFLDTVYGLYRLNRTDPSQIDESLAMYATGAVLFAWSGISYGIARRLLDVTGSLVRHGSIGDTFVYEAMRFILSYLHGDWDDQLEVEDRLVQEALRYGKHWDVNTYVGLLCDMRLRQGRFEEARRHLETLKDISESYGYEFSHTNFLGMTAILLAEQRRLEEALAAIEEYHGGLAEDALEVLALGTRAKIQVLLGDLAAARESIAKGEEIVQRSGVVPPWHQVALAVGRLLHETALLEQAGAAAPAALRRQARRSARRAVRLVGVVAPQRTEVYRLVGRMWHVLGKPKKAFEWWARSITVGKTLGTRPELARAYRDVAGALAGLQQGPRTWDGKDAAAYVEMARTLFAEMQLDNDALRLRAA